MAKLKNDKYYTPSELAKYCVEKTRQVIGRDNITEYIEPAAGSGVFLDYFDMPYIAYDISPEDERIRRADWLEVDIPYKKGRCVIGNPPFGDKNTLSVSFYKKSINVADYIAFILPISQLNNNQQMYEFDLIYSEDLGMQYYTDRKLHCCFNIYRRPESGVLNTRPNYKLRDVIIKENRRTGAQISKNNYDIGICSFGGGSIGKVPSYIGQYAKEFWFVINNDKYRNQIVELIVKTNWEKDVCRSISGQANLAQWQVYKYLKEKIPDLE